MDKTRPTIPQTLERLSLAFAGAVVLFIGILTYNSADAGRRSSEQAAVTRQVVEKANSLLSSLKDAETGTARLSPHRRDRYLEPYSRALTQVFPALDTLARIEAERHRADQAQRVERLRPLVQDKLDELAQTIEFRRNQGPEAALAIVRTNRGIALMDRIRSICAEIEAASYELRARQAEEARTRSNETGLIAIVGSAAIFALLILSTISIEKGTRRRQELIGELQETEDQLRRSRDWLQTTLASIGDAVITSDEAGKITLLNPVAQSLTGWKNEEAIGQSLDRIFVIRNEETGHEVENPVAKVLRHGAVVGLANHTFLIAKDGRHVPIDDSAAPIRDGGGQIAGVVLVFRDITTRRDAEARLAVQTAQLRRTNHLMEGVACFVRDLQDAIVYWNPGAADLYGFTAEEALGRVSHALLRTEFPAPLNEILAQFETAGKWDGELLQTQRDGARITVASHWAMHRDPDGRPAAILEVNVDITQRKLAEEALRLSNAALLRANEDLNQFAFAASHDLQEPLRMITSYSQLLLKGYSGQLDSEASTCVEFIVEGNKRMRGLLADLLAYTQLAGDAPEAVGLVDLNRVFQVAFQNCQSAIEETHAAVTADTLPAIHGYAPHFVQLFQNLIGNAIKYRGQDLPRIHVSAQRQDSAWRIAVQDNGIVIAPEYHRQIFGVFKRLHGKTIPGTGIGLAICKRVVERYGGQIWVESQVNRGSTFYFTLPAAGGAGEQEGRA